MTQSSPQLPQSQHELEEIYSLIRPFIIKTPVLSSDVINQLCGAEIFFKCENFQKIGAFKARGAVHAIKRLSAEQLKNGVATHSSGNHAQALAYAATLVKAPAYIVMPENSARVKLEGVKRLGAEVILCESTPEAREKKLEEVVAKTGAFFVPPFNHEWVIAGQGTAAKELIEEIPGLETIVAPTGGGGLLSGTAIFANLLSKEIKVYGAEPENVNDALRSFQSGVIEKNETGKTSIADGLRTSLGDKTLYCIRNYVEDILTVSEEEIVEAMKIMWTQLKITAEPSSAVTLAAIMKHKAIFGGRRTGVIVSGGNVDLSSLPF
jgi:threonine dehydratase